MLGGHLDQLLVERLGTLHLVGRDVELLAAAVLVLEAVHLHQPHVDEGVELRTLIHGVLHDDGLHARSGADALDRGLEVGFLGVELVHHPDQGFVEQPRIAGLNLAAHLPAVLGVDEENPDVAHLEGREEVAAEVVRARAVDDVELAVHELREEDGRIDRPLVFVLDIGVVRKRVVGFDAAPAVDDFAFKSHRLGQGGLTRAGGSDQYDGFDLFG